MQQNEKFKDWLFRYQYVYRIRSTEKSKGRFISALVKDISEMRKDIHVIEYNRHRKYASRNVYVGNIETADKIICTYYDTPLKSYGSYELFNLKEQKKRTLGLILASSIMMIILGIIGTFIYMQHTKSAFNLTSFSTILIILIYGVYFLLLGKITKGLASRKTLIRNTSSILALLEIISETKDEKTAFAFIDEGSFGEAGLEVLSTSHKKKAKIFMLDSIGSDAPLHVLGDDFPKDKMTKLKIDYPLSNLRINHIFSARTLEREQKTIFYLNKSDLKKNTIDIKNLTKVVELFK